MFALGWLAFNVLFVVFLVKGIKQKDKTMKKTAWIMFAGAVVCFFVVAWQGKASSENTGVTEVEEKSLPAVEASSEEVNAGTAAVEASVATEPAAESVEKEVEEPVPDPEPEQKAETSESEEAEAAMKVAESMEETVETEAEYTNIYAEKDDDPYAGYTDDQKKALYIAAARIVLDEAYEGNYEVKETDDGIIINVWRDGVAMGAMLLVGGDESLRESWQIMVDGTQSMAQSMYDSALEMGITKPISVNVLNDINKDNSLLCFINGVLFYDVTE